MELGAENQARGAFDGRPLLAVHKLTKRYRSGTLANDHLDLELEGGEVFGLLGPNGAGKTTLVKQIIGLVKPTSGSIFLDGHDLIRHPSRARQLCSFLPQGTLPIESLRTREAIEMVGRIRGGGRREVQQRTERLIARLEIEEWAGSLGIKCSGGVLRLVGFAMACVWPARLVILDEPTNDVDPLRRRLLWREIRQLGDQGATVLLVTHNVLEAEHSVDRLAVIDGGRILDQGTPSSLKATGPDTLRLELNLLPNVEAPPAPAFARHCVRLSRRLWLTIAEADAPEAIHWARREVAHRRAEAYSLGATTLEDTYLRLIGRSDALSDAAAIGAVEHAP